MLGVDPGIRDVFGQIVQHMADIMQQGRHDQRLWRTIAFGEDRALQRMLELADALAIAFMAALRKGGADFIQRVFRGRAHAAASARLVVPRFNTRRRLSMPSRSM